MSKFAETKTEIFSRKLGTSLKEKYVMLTIVPVLFYKQVLLTEFTAVEIN